MDSQTKTSMQGNRLQRMPENSFSPASVVQKKNRQKQDFELVDNRSESAMEQGLLSLIDTSANAQFKVLQRAGKQGNGVLQMKSYAPEAASINQYTRAMIPYAGNRTQEVIDAKGNSYAGVALLDYLLREEHEDNWEAPLCLAHRATLAVDLGAANCNQFAALAYCQAREETTAENVALEYDAAHAYAVAFDNEDSPENQTIIDPWVKITGLRKEQQAYYQNRAGLQRAKAPADQQHWYYPGYTQRLLAKYNRQKNDAIYGATAAYGLTRAEEAKRQGKDYF